MRWFLVLILAGCAPTPGGGSGGGDGGAGDAGLDATAGDAGSDAVAGDFGPDGPPPRSCEELEAAIAAAVNSGQSCVVDSQCVVVGGPQACACGSVVGAPDGVVMHFNEARGGLQAYGELLQRCAADGVQVCDTPPSTASCNDRGDCVLETGGDGCEPDSGVPAPDMGPPGPDCEQLRAELLATVAAEGSCDVADDCALVGGSSSCRCNQHVGPPGGYGVRLDAAARLQQLVELIRTGGCADRESCDEPPASERDPDCVGGTCRAGGGGACE